MLSSTKKNFIIAATYSLVLALGILLGQNFADERKGESTHAVLPLGLTDKTGKLQKVMQVISQRYVDHVRIDTLQDFAISEVLKHLDPHSVYLSSRKSEALSRNLSGSFSGIGAEVYIVNDTLFVTGLVPGGPAEKSGVKRGDKLLWINDISLAGVNISHEKVSELVRGKKGSSLQLWLKRDNVELVHPIEVIRDDIAVNTIVATYRIDSATAYIKIQQFGINTAEEFVSALSKFKKVNIKNLIIDLRGNGGGYFSEAMSILEELLPEGSLMVYTQGANQMRNDYFSSGEGLFLDGKVAVLIDENSASASEIVAGAIQDLNRGIVIGRRSYGKGLIQQKFSFGDGSALNLSVARYYTPSGRSIQKPYRDGNVQYFNELNQRFLKGELTSGLTDDVDTIAADGRIYRTGRGKAMISEGGIMPDIYVKLDTLGVNSFYLQLVDHQLISNYVYTYLVDVPPSYSGKSFIEDYTIPPTVYPHFLKLAQEKELSFTGKESSDCRALIEADMKALLGRYFFGDEVWYKTKNANDGVLARCMEALKED